MNRIAFYGKGGIGKSTIISNIAVALAKTGSKVMLIGCDPKSDSSINIMNGKRIPTVLDQIMEKGENVSLEDIAFVGDCGVICMEAGGPAPGMGCAGRGIISAFEKIEELQAYRIYKPDIVLFDVLGDVVCGGFAMPIRQGYADYVCVVTSGEKMSLYAADNILKAVRSFSRRGYAEVGGLIINERNVNSEEEIIAEWANEREVSILATIPRSETIQLAEEKSKTVVLDSPNSNQAKVLLKTANIIKNLNKNGEGCNEF